MSICSNCIHSEIRECSKGFVLGTDECGSYEENKGYNNICLRTIGRMTRSDMETVINDRINEKEFDYVYFEENKVILALCDGSEIEIGINFDKHYIDGKEISLTVKELLEDNK